MEKPWASHVRYPCACLQSWACGLSQKHLAAYALECQTSLNMNLLPGDAAYTCSKEMLAAVGALVEMQGIVRMMQQICSGVVFEQRDKVGILKTVDIPKMATTWWTTLRTLLAHRCWKLLKIFLLCHTFSRRKCYGC